MEPLAQTNQNKTASFALAMLAFTAKGGVILTSVIVFVWSTIQFGYTIDINYYLIGLIDGNESFPMLKNIRYVSAIMGIFFGIIQVQAVGLIPQLSFWFVWLKAKESLNESRKRFIFLKVQLILFLLCNSIIVLSVLGAYSVELIQHLVEGSHAGALIMVMTAHTLLYLPHTVMGCILYRRKMKGW